MKPDLFNIIPYTFNKILKNHPELVDEFIIYKGSILLVDLINTNTRLYFLIGDEGMEVFNQPVDKPDLTIRATPLELFQYFFRIRSNSMSVSGEIELLGNIGMAQKIQNVFFNFDIDWEENTSQIIGDELSHSLFYGLGKFIENFNYGKQELINNFAEFLKFERDIVIDDYEIRTFNNSVDQLRDDVEKLNLRVNRISQMLETS